MHSHSTEVLYLLSSLSSCIYFHCVWGMRYSEIILGNIPLINGWFSFENTPEFKAGEVGSVKDGPVGGEGKRGR